MSAALGRSQVGGMALCTTLFPSLYISASLLVILPQSSWFLELWYLLLLQNAPQSILTQGIPHKKCSSVLSLTAQPQMNWKWNIATLQDTCYSSFPPLKQPINRIITEHIKSLIYFLSIRDGKALWTTTLRNPQPNPSFPSFSIFMKTLPAYI